MSTPIVNKNTTTRNKLPALSQVTRGELVVSHRTAETAGMPDAVDTCLGVYIRVGKTVADDPTDKIIRIGPALVTSNNVLPALVGIEDAPENKDWTGSLWWRKDSKQFLVNVDGTEEGWEVVVPSNTQATTASSGTVTLATLADIYKGENEIKVVTAAGLKAYMDAAQAGSQYLVYVDPGNPNSSDSKKNRGNDPRRPFKSPQRALLEVARRSFVRNTVGGPAQNDVTEKMTVYIAPGLYTIYNGLGGDVDLANYGRYRDAANLILLNREYIADSAMAAIPLVSRTDTCRRDIYFYIDALANDIAARGNTNIIRSAKFIRNPNGTYIPAYDSSTERSETRTALAALAAAAILSIKNLGAVTDDTIIVDPSPNPCLDVQTSISTLVDILDATLDSSGSGVNPHNPAQVPPNEGYISASFPEEGEPTPQNLQGFNNNVKAGVILPRGVSIIGPDLRKVVFRPAYVPSSDGSQGKSSIYRMTGSNFFQGFTIRDRIGQTTSAHNLSCFSFCTQPDLQNYYDKVAAVFQDPSYYHQNQDAANLIQANVNWITEKVRESTVYTLATVDQRVAYDQYAIDIVVAIAQDVRGGTNGQCLRIAGVILEDTLSLFTPGPTRTAFEAFLGQVFTALADYSKVALRNAALPSEGGFVDPSIIQDGNNFSNPCINVQNNVDTLADIMTAVVEGDVPPDLNLPVFGIGDVEAVDPETQIVGLVSQNSVPNTVDGASPYIFSASLRSVWGMSGINGDGADVTGFKSYVAAQFTIVSLQSDPGAFVGTGPGTGQVASKRYRGTLSADLTDYRNFGYAVRNEAYAQLVSCFCIGPAIHYHCTAGAEFSITNSTSNFGDVSLQSEGFVGQAGTGGAYVQDTDYVWKEIVRPRIIDKSNPTRAAVGLYSTRTSSKIVLEQDINFDDINPYTIRTGSRVYVVYTTVEIIDNEPQLVENILSATVAAPGINRDTLNKFEIPISTFHGTWPANDVLEGLTVSILRVVDSRSQEEKIFRVRVEAPVISRGRPLENFIFRFKYNAPLGSPTYQRQLPYAQGTVAYVAESVAYEPEVRTYDLTLLDGFKSPEGEAQNNLDFYPVIDLDFDPVYQTSQILDSPPTSPTYQILDGILEQLGYSAPSRDAILVANATDYAFPVAPSNLRPTVEFNKPSIIRCGGQTWEYLGYYNYDTAIPVAQTSTLGAGLPENEAADLKRLKLQTERKGGRIYATGLNEEGDFFIGPTKINTRTGQTSDTRLNGTEDPDLITFKRVNIVQALTMLPNSAQRFQVGASVIFDAGSKFQVSQDPELPTGGVKAYYSRVDGLETRRYGFARPATTFEAQNEVSTDNRSNFVSPANLAEWRTAKQLVSLRTASVPIYVGNWPGGSPTGYNSSYNASFWPEPAFPVVALSQNPGLTFAPFRTISDAARWANDNLQVTETAVLYVSPGYYDISATFNCNVILNGVGNGDVVNLDTGNYTNTTTNSVLLYRSLRFATNAIPTGTDRGKLYPWGIGLSGSLTMNGPGTSRISNVGIVSPIQAYSALRGAALGGRSPIEDLLIAALNLQYTSQLDNSLHYLLNNTAGGPADRIRTMFGEEVQQPLLRKTAGRLELERVVIEAQAPYYSETVNFEYRHDGLIRLELDADLVWTGVALRGNETFTIPKVITVGISGITYSIANTARTSVGDNFTGVGPPNLPLTQPPSEINWITHAYESTVAGVPQNGGSYVTVFGHSPTVINILSGASDLTFRNNRFIRDNNLFNNFNDDRNNIRLECNFKGSYAVSVTERGTASLGVAGTVNLVEPNELTFYNELMGIAATKRGPMISSFLILGRREVKCSLLQNYTGQGQGVAGWRGAFGYIPTLTNQRLTGRSFKITSVVMAHTDLQLLATGINLTRNFSDFWGSAGALPGNLTLTESVRDAVRRNVFWRSYSPGFYPGPNATTSTTVTTTNLRRQQSSNANDDAATITNSTESNFFLPNTIAAPASNFTFTGANPSVI